MNPFLIALAIGAACLSIVCGLLAYLGKRNSGDTTFFLGLLFVILAVVSIAATVNLAATWDTIHNSQTVQTR